jgi:hypothetical protein
LQLPDEMPPHAYAGGPDRFRFRGRFLVLVLADIGDTQIGQ